MAIIFKEPVLHGRIQFLPGVPVAVPGAEHYFVAAGWASTTTETPVFSYNDVEYDSNATQDGKLLLPEEASQPSEDE